MANDPTRPNAETRSAEAAEVGAAHDADRAPTSDEEAAADANHLDPAVARQYKLANERGAAQEGEGRIP